MDEPKFPQDFVDKHCPRREFAECAFIPAGVGLTCENCKIFVSSFPCLHEIDHFYPSIRQYYDDIDKYEAEYFINQQGDGI